jgi:hypothetical protein
VAVFAALLVVLGVVGELQVESELGLLDSQVVVITGSLIDITSREAENATFSAIRAHIAADSADESAHRALSLEEQVEQTTKKAIVNIDRTQSALKWRTVPPRGNWLGELRLFSPQTVILYSPGPEPMNLVDEITELLDMKWGIWGSPSDHIKIRYGSGPTETISVNSLSPTGVRIAGDGVTIIAKGQPNKSKPWDAAVILCDVLKDNGVACDNIRRSDVWPLGVPDDAVWIIVGRNPALGCLEISSRAILKAEIERQENACWEGIESGPRVDEVQRAEILSRYGKLEGKAN